MRRLQYQNGEIDAIDRKLLSMLIANARVPNAELARLVKLSGPSVAERIKRLEEAGVIEGYAAKVNPEALGLPLAALLRVRPMPGQLEKVASILRGLPEVVECDRVTGEDCFVARAHVKSVKELERLIDAIIPFAMTNTSVVQSTPVPRRLPPIGARKR